MTAPVFTLRPPPRLELPYTLEDRLKAALAGSFANQYQWLDELYRTLHLLHGLLYNLGTGLTTDTSNRLAVSALLAAIFGITPSDGVFIVGDGSTWVGESGATARESLGLVIGTNVQAWDDDLDDIADLTPADGNFIVGDGSDWVAESGATARASMDAQQFSELLKDIVDAGAPAAQQILKGNAGGTEWELGPVYSQSSAANALVQADATGGIERGWLGISTVGALPYSLVTGKMTQLNLSATQGAPLLAGASAPQYGGEMDMGNDKITNLADPTLDQDAATKNYVDDLVKTLTYVPDTVTTNTGTRTAGDEDSVATIDDADTYDVDEVAGSPGFDIDADFSSIPTDTKFNHILFHVYYNGSAGHTVNVDLWNYDTTTWDTIGAGAITDATDYEFIDVSVADATDYVDVSGNANCRIYHSSAGNITHDISIDYWVLQWNPLGGSGSVADHGALSGLSDDDHAQYLRADGTRALSANWDAGSFKITAQQLESDVATGTAPLVVASTTVVTNLNADTVDGKDSTALVLVDGSQAMSGNLQMGSNKITGLADGAASTDGAAYGQLASDNVSDTVTFARRMPKSTGAGSLSMTDPYIRNSGGAKNTVIVGHTAATGVDTYVNFQWHPPARFDLGSAITATLKVMGHSGTDGDVKVGWDLRGCNDGEDRTSGGTTFSGSTTETITDIWYEEHISLGTLFTASSLSTDETVEGSIYREGTDASDTYGATLQILAITFKGTRKRHT